MPRSDKASGALGKLPPSTGGNNAVLGLIGCGRIGLQAARKFKALGFAHLLAADPFLDRDVAEAEGIEIVDIDSVCMQADVISLHAPLTPKTRHMINADRIALFKQTAILVNVSRGGLVDEAALAKALTEGRLFGAGIDVFEQEPIHKDNPLMSCPRTVLSDHTAWYSERSLGILKQNAALEIDRVLRDDPPKNWVNKW